MKTTTVPSFHIIGKAIRTTNENGQAATAIPQLWQAFFSGQVAAGIPAKTDTAIYCVYTDYESDHTKPYTTILGCKVDNLDSIPEGLTGITIGGGTYKVFSPEGNIAGGLVFNEWTKIWAMPLDRAYTADYEVYNEAALSDPDAVVDIFIAVR